MSVNSVPSVMTKESEKYRVCEDCNGNHDENEVLRRKNELVKNEFDRIGMGRYQWYLFALCGFGFTLDLLWAVSFSLILGQLQREFGFSDAELGHIPTAFTAGMAAGAFTWGMIIDIIGRQWGFNLTVLIASIFGLILGVPSSYDAIIVISAFVGFGVGGNVPIDATMLLEVLPSNKHHLLTLLCVFQPLGIVICTVIAYGLIPNYSCSPELKPCHNTLPGQPCCSKAENYGWRYLIFTIGGITFAMFFARVGFFRFYESPQFLIHQKRDSEALSVIRKISEFNRTPDASTVSLTSSDMEAQHLRNPSDPDSGLILDDGCASRSKKYRLCHLGALFNSRTMIWLTVLTWIIYATDYWAFTLAGTYFPIIIARKGAAINVTVQATYRNYIIIYICGIPACFLGAILPRIHSLDTKRILVLGSALFSISLFLFVIGSTEAEFVGLASMEYFFQSLFNAILYGWLPTAFPTKVRGSASGIAGFWGRLCAIMAPIAGAQLLIRGTNEVLYVAGAGALMCTIAVALLPHESMTDVE